MRHSREDAAPKTLAQLKKLIKEKTEEYLHENFSWGSIEEQIKRVLETRVDDIVAAALGFRKDSFGRGWELQAFDQSRGVHLVLRDLAIQHAEKLIPPLIEEAEKTAKKMALSKKGKADIVATYKDYFDRALRDQVDEWIKEKAAADVDEIFERGSDAFFEEIQLKVPLVMHDHLGMVADDGES